MRTTCGLEKGAGIADDVGALVGATCAGISLVDRFGMTDGVDTAVGTANGLGGVAEACGMIGFIWAGVAC